MDETKVHVARLVVADLQILLEQGQHVRIARIVLLRRNARRFDDDEQMVILE
jgi:hypothetical protein